MIIIKDLILPSRNTDVNELNSNRVLSISHYSVMGFVLRGQFGGFQMKGVQKRSRDCGLVSGMSDEVIYQSDGIHHLNCETKYYKFASWFPPSQKPDVLFVCLHPSC